MTSTQKEDSPDFEGEGDHWKSHVKIHQNSVDYVLEKNEKVSIKKSGFVSSDHYIITQVLTGETYKVKPAAGGQELGETFQKKEIERVA